MSDEVESAAVALDKAIRASLDKIAALLDQARDEMRSLGDSGRAINGLRGLMQATSGEVEETAKKVRAERDDVSKALLGTPRVQITESYNAELAAAVVSDPARKR